MSATESYDVSVEWDSPEPGIKTILHKLRPSWKSDQIKFKALTGGNQNKIILCLPPGGSTVPEGSPPEGASGAGEEDGLTFRIFGTYSSIYQIDKEREIGNLRLLNAAGQGSHLVARFNNGYIVKYVTGEAVTAAQCEDPHILRLIAEELARIHSASSHGDFQPIRDRNCQPEDFNHFDPIIRKCLDKLAEGFGHETIDKRLRDAVNVEEYRLEYTSLMKKLRSLGMETRLCHNDVGPANFIYNKHDDIVRMVDFESCDMNFSAFDVRKIFTFTTGFPFDATKVPSDDVIKTFLEHYLRHRRTLENTSGDVTKEDVERLYKATYNCFVLGMLMMSVFVPTLEKKNIENGTDIDFTTISLSFWKEYQKRKSTVFEVL